MNNPLGGVYNNGFSGQMKENIELGYPQNLSNIKDGIITDACNVQQGVDAGQNLHSFPSSSLHMSQIGGGLTNALSQRQFASVRDQPVCLEADGQSAWQGAQYGGNKGGYDGLVFAEQPSLVNSFCQVTGFPSTNAPDVGGGGNTASDDVTEFLVKLQEKHNMSSHTSGDI